MSTLPQRQLGLVITIALAVLGAAVVSAVMFTSGRADEVDLTTANYVPKDAAVYVAFNTDLGTSQWVDAFALIERLGEDDPEQQLRDAAEDDGDLDWEDDIAPFLGGNAAFYLQSFDADSFAVHGAFIVETKDGDRAFEVMVREADMDLETALYKGVEYSTDNEVGWLALLGDHLVFGLSEESLFDVIDAHQNGESLATVDDFARLRDELTRNFLSFVYVSPDALVDDMFGENGPFGGLGGVDTESDIPALAGVIGAAGDAFEFQAASVTDGGEVAPALQPRVSRFADVVPGETMVFFSTYDVATAWDGAFETMRDLIMGVDLDEIPLPIDSSGYDGEIESVQDGMNAADDFLSGLDGEFALAMWSRDGSVEGSDAVLLVETNQPGRSLIAFERIVRAFTDEGPGLTSIGGRNVATLENGFAFAAGDDFLVMGTEDGVRAVLEGGATPLSGNATYTSTVAQMPSALGTYVYVDLAGALRLSEGGIPADLDQAERALGGMIVNAVIERGVVRASGVLSIPGE